MKENQIGIKYGRLTVLEYFGIKVSPCGTKNELYNCGCECGNEKIVMIKNLRKGNTKSCGCYKAETSSRNGYQIKHGHNKKRKTSLTYISWQRMKQRCTYIKDKNYDIYGGRGIKVCHRWINSFENFLQDMGERPSKLHSIDRIDPNGNYEPNNCRWTTMKEQQNNRRNNKRNAKSKA